MAWNCSAMRCVEFGDELTRAADRRQQVVLLRFEVGQPIAHRRMLLGRERVAGAQLVVAATEGRLATRGRGSEAVAAAPVGPAAVQASMAASRAASSAAAKASSSGSTWSAAATISPAARRRAARPTAPRPASSTRNDSRTASRPRRASISVISAARARSSARRSRSRAAVASASNATRRRRSSVSAVSSAASASAAATSASRAAASSADVPESARRATSAPSACPTVAASTAARRSSSMPNATSARRRRSSATRRAWEAASRPARRFADAPAAPPPAPATRPVRHRRRLLRIPLAALRRQARRPPGRPWQPAPPRRQAARAARLHQLPAGLLRHAGRDALLLLRSEASLTSVVNGATRRRRALACHGGLTRRDRQGGRRLRGLGSQAVEFAGQAIMLGAPLQDRVGPAQRHHAIGAHDLARRRRRRQPAGRTARSPSASSSSGTHGRSPATARRDLRGRGGWHPPGDRRRRPHSVEGSCQRTSGARRPGRRRGPACPRSPRSGRTADRATAAARIVWPSAASTALRRDGSTSSPSATRRPPRRRAATPMPPSPVRRAAPRAWPAAHGRPPGAPRAPAAREARPSAAPGRPPRPARASSAARSAMTSAARAATSPPSRDRAAPRPCGPPVGRVERPPRLVGTARSLDRRRRSALGLGALRGPDPPQGRPALRRDGARLLGSGQLRPRGGQLAVDRHQGRLGLPVRLRQGQGQCAVAIGDAGVQRRPLRREASPLALGGGDLSLRLCSGQAKLGHPQSSRLQGGTGGVRDLVTLGERAGDAGGALLCRRQGARPSSA